MVFGKNKKIYKKFFIYLFEFIVSLIKFYWFNNKFVKKFFFFFFKLKKIYRVNYKLFIVLEFSVVFIILFFFD